jgi:type VI secretion system protein ImpK
MERAQQVRPRRSLQDLATGLFSVILSLRGSSSYGSEDALRQRIKAFLDGIDREGLDAGLGQDDIRAVKYPLLAFIDETILGSNWEHRELWRTNPLVNELFNDRLAGTRFFTNLNEIRRGGDARHDLLEVYHLCLTLGFEGQYRVAGREQLRPLIDEIRRELGHDPRDRREIRLSPNGKRRDNPVAGAAGGFPLWWAVGGGAGALLVLYVILRLAIGGTAHKVLALLR